MIELLAIISGPISLMAAFLGMIWVMRCKSCIFSKDGVMPLVVFAYAIWHFLVHQDLPADHHMVIHNLFLTFVAFTIAIQCNIAKFSLKVNRRKIDKTIKFKGRRYDD